MGFADRRDDCADGQATPPPKDPFEVLGIPPTASRREITEAYRALARKHHPDRHAKSSVRRRREAERHMQELNEAYRVARSRPAEPAYRGTGAVPSAALWLGTAPGTWARTGRRSGGPTEEERRLSQVQIAEAAREHEARARVTRETRLRAEEEAGMGQARSQAKRRSHAGQGKALAGMGQALATNQIRCKGCRSLQSLPSGWQSRLDDTDYICSGCQHVLLAR